MGTKRAFLKRMLSSILFVLILESSANCAGLYLHVPDVYQERSYWCWAAVSKSILAYYRSDQLQCVVANIGTGRNDCCVPTAYNANTPCNKPKPTSVVVDILAQNQLKGEGSLGALSWNNSILEINSGRPFVMGLIETLYDGSLKGHYIVGDGYDLNGKLIYYMDPDYASGHTADNYDNLVRLKDSFGNTYRWWNDTLRIVTNTQAVCDIWYAQSISNSGATMYGAVKSNNLNTIVSFEYGSSTNYGNTIAADQNPVAGATTTTVSKAINGLAPATLYHYRIKAVNSAGTFFSGDQTFTTLDYALTTSKLGTGTGTINTYQVPFYPGITAYRLEAIPAPGNIFTGWSGSCSGTGDCNITMLSNRTVSATFDLIKYETLTVSKLGTGKGTITSTSPPSVVNCNSSCSYPLVQKTALTLSATPNPGNIFIGWSGACSGRGSCSVTMGSPQSVSANFVPDITPILTLLLDDDDPLDAIVTMPDAGLRAAVNASLGRNAATSIRKRDMANLTTLIASGMGIIDLTGLELAVNLSSVDLRNNLITSTAPLAGLTLLSPTSLNLDGNPALPLLTITKTGNGVGTVATSSAEIICGDTCTRTYITGTTVTLVPTVAAGSRFTGWTGCDSVAGNACSVTITSGRNVAAAFKRLDIVPILDLLLND